MLILLVKSQQQLFDAPVQVAGHVRKDGVFVDPHVRIQKVAPHKPAAPARAKPAPVKGETPDLFADIPEEHAQAEPEPTPAEAPPAPHVETRAEAPAAQPAPDVSAPGPADVQADGVDTPPPFSDYKGDRHAYFKARVLWDLGPKRYGGRLTADRLAGINGDPDKEGYGAPLDEVQAAVDSLIEEGKIKKVGRAVELASSGKNPPVDSPVSPVAHPVADVVSPEPEPVAAIAEPEPTPAAIAHDRQAPFGVCAGITKGERRAINAKVAQLVADGLTDPDLMRQYSGNGGCADSLNEFYTDPGVARAMWDALGRLGFTSGTALEPSCATGVFLHTAPPGVRVTGVELEPISAACCLALNGDRHEVVTASLERFATQDGRQFDAVVGNPPYGPRGWLAKDDKVDISTAEQYFVDTSLDKCKAGGLVALVVPTGIMDNSGARAFRESMLCKSVFLGAMRMPNTAFEASHTEVTTDVIFLRKRPDEVAGALATLTQDQLQALHVWDDEFLSGSYFTGRGAPNVLGTMGPGWRAQAGMGNDITVNGSMQGVADAIGQFTPDPVGRDEHLSVHEILASLPDMKARDKATSGSLRVPYSRQAKVGDTKTIDGVAYVLQGDPPRWHRVDEFMASNSVAAAQPIAAEIDRLLAGETVDRPKLEADIRAYVEKHGIPADDANLMVAARVDKALFRLVGAVNRKGELSDTVLGVERKTETSFDASAQALALDKDGEFTAAALAERLGKPVADVEDQLAADPNYAYLGGDEWTTMAVYLTGELWPKLDAANAYVAAGKPLADKVKAQAARLDELIDPKTLDDVDIQINTAFVPLHVVSAYMTWRNTEGPGASNYTQKYPPIEVTFKDGVYSVKGGAGNWGTQELLFRILNRDGVKKKEIEEVAELNRDFKDWLCASPYRDAVEELYNRKFKGYVEQSFSTEPIDVPGMNPDRQVRPWIWSGLRRAMSQGKGIIADDVGLGKAQPLDAKILTPGGWVLMGDIRVGDWVIAGDGSPTKVLGVFPQGEKEIFKVGFHDGSATECCDEHLWFTQTYLERNNARRSQSGTGLGRVRELKDIAQSLLAFDAAHPDGIKNHAIPMVGAVQFNERKTPIDPYVLGVLIGDGSSYNPLWRDLVTLGLQGLTSERKFVPDCYLFNTAAVRVAILQGLMDTDGYVCSVGVTVQFSSSSERLAKDVQFLVNSLGGNATISSKIPTFTGTDGSKKEGRMHYTVHMRMPPDVMPFRLQRKIDRVKPKSKYLPVRYITSVEPVGVKPAQCIMVEHWSHLYVTDDFLVTHNTVQGLLLARLSKIDGRCKKPVIMVPKSVLANWWDESQIWFPGSRVLTIGGNFSYNEAGEVVGRDDDADERKRKYHDLTQNDYDFVLISEPAFEEVDLDPKTKADFYESDFMVQRGNAMGNEGDKNAKKIRAARANFEQGLAKREFADHTDAIYFNELGVDMLLADEAHHQKNLYAARQRFGESPKFLGGQGQSSRALDFNLKTRWLRGQHDGKGVYGLTATPTSNSPLEIYSMLSHISPEDFENIGIRNAEEFLDRFCEFKRGNILSTAGAIEDALVTSGFKNLDELRGIMARYIARRTAEDVGLELPARNDQTHLIDMTPAQQAVYAELRELAESVEKDATGDAHPFAIMSNMNKAAIDLSMLGPEHAGAASPKYAEVAKQCIEGAKEGGQIVFCEYIESHDKLRQALIDAGMKASEIGIINAKVAPSAAKRLSIAQALNSGKLKVVIGNCTMAEGLNMQKSTTDIHHLDIPWAPSGLQQRNGRGLRQGNRNKTVRIHSYLAKGSFDGYRYQSTTAKKNWQDLLWKGGDRVENLAQEGNLTLDDMRIMLAADPDAARAAYDKDKTAAQLRFDSGQRVEAQAEFVRFKDLQHSLATLKNKATPTAERLRAKLASAKTRLFNNRNFTAKSALDTDGDVLIEPTSGLVMQKDAAFHELDADGQNDTPYVVTGVDMRRGTVRLRKYADASGAREVTRSLKDLRNVVPFKLDKDAEAAEVTVKLTADAEAKINSITDWDDVQRMPSAVLEQNHDVLQAQLKAGAKSHRVKFPYDQVAMVDRATGKLKMAASYEHGHMGETHDYWLPTDAGKELASQAWIDARRGSKIGDRMQTTGNKRHQKKTWHAAREYAESSYDKKNVNPVTGLLNTLDQVPHTLDQVPHYGGALGPSAKAAKARFETEQVQRIRRAKSARDILEDLTPLAKLSGSEDSNVAKYPHQALMMAWARARHLGLLAGPAPVAGRHAGYAFGPLHTDRRAGQPSNLHATLLSMARASGDDALIDAMAVSGEKHIPQKSRSHDLETLRALTSADMPTLKQLQVIHAAALRQGLLGTTIGQAREHGLGGAFAPGNYGYGWGAREATRNDMTIGAKIEELYNHPKNNPLKEAA